MLVGAAVDESVNAVFEKCFVEIDEEPKFVVAEFEVADYLSAVNGFYLCY